MTSTPPPPYKVTPNPKPMDLDGLLNGPPATLNEDQVSVTARLVVDCRCRLGECVLWDDRTNSVLFTSILDQTFHKLQLNSNPTTADLQTYQLPKMLCAFGLLENTNDSSNAYLVTWEDGFQLYNLEENAALSDMSVGEVVNPLGLPDRLNDGRCDPTGNYFICAGRQRKDGSFDHRGYSRLIGLDDKIKARCIFGYLY
jgi:sugar lactone lactonase YvrE